MDACGQGPDRDRGRWKGEKAGMDDWLVARDYRKGKYLLYCTQCWLCAPCSSMTWRALHCCIQIYLEECFYQNFTAFYCSLECRNVFDPISLPWHRQPLPAVLRLRDSSVRSVQVFLSLLMSQLFLEENYCVYDLGAWYCFTAERSVVSTCAFETTLALLAWAQSSAYPIKHDWKDTLNYV